MTSYAKAGARDFNTDALIQIRDHCRTVLKYGREHMEDHEIKAFEDTARGICSLMDIAAS